MCLEASQVVDDGNVASPSIPTRALYRILIWRTDMDDELNDAQWADWNRQMAYDHMSAGDDYRLWDLDPAYLGNEIAEVRTALGRWA